MKIEDLKIGMSIKRLNPYDGEGEYIVGDIFPSRKEFLGIAALFESESYNGARCRMDFSDLDCYEPVIDSL